MFFQRIKTPGIAHNAYLLASNKTGIIIDPRRDIDEYIKIARSNGIDIKYVLETHRQEDFVLGSKTIKSLLDAKIIGGIHELFSYCDIRLQDGEKITIEDFTIKALCTPGHTPESMSYAFYMKDKEDCWAVFTGDALFIGEAGRTDLPALEKTAENAEILYNSIHEKILPLGPQTLLYPAHGSGSVCGGNIAEYDESTLGFERTYNPAFTKSKEEFIQLKLKERIPRPPYFSLMEKMNLYGGKPLEKKVDSIKILSPKEFSEESRTGVIIDTRLPESFAGGHIPGSFSVWLEGLAVFGGYICDKDTSLYLVLERAEDLKTAFNYLTRIGMENIEGVLADGFENWRNQGFPIEKCGSISAEELNDKLNDFLVLDVREISEYEEDGHIPYSLNCYVGNLGEFSKNYKKNGAIAVTCSVGHRASLAASVLLKMGYSRVYNLLGGMTAWEKLKFKMVKGPESSLYYHNQYEKTELIEKQLSH